MSYFVVENPADIFDQFWHLNHPVTTHLKLCGHRIKSSDVNANLHGNFIRFR